MRAILIDWLIDVHKKFRLKEETFFHTIMLMDKYLEQECIKRTEL